MARAGHFQAYTFNLEGLIVANQLQTFNCTGTFKQPKFTTFTANGYQIGIGCYCNIGVARDDSPCLVG